MTHQRVDSFEQLIAWQKSRDLCRLVYEMTSKPPLARDFGYTGQLQRAAVSVMSNIAEGFERAGRGELHQFLSVAKGSCAEVRSLLYVGLDAGYIPPQTFEMLRERTYELARIIGGFRAAVARQRDEEARGHSS